MKIAKNVIVSMAVPAIVVLFFYGVFVFIATTAHRAAHVTEQSSQVEERVSNFAPLPKLVNIHEFTNRNREFCTVVQDRRSDTLALHCSPTAEFK